MRDIDNSSVEKLSDTVIRDFSLVGFCSGILVESIEEAVAAVPRAAAMDRKVVRQTFEERFSVPHMATNYVRLYEKMAQAKKLDDSTKTNTLLQAAGKFLAAGSIDGDGAALTSLSTALKQQAA